MTTKTAPYPGAAVRETGISRTVLGLGLGVVSAILLILAFQPYSFWPLAFIAYVPMQLAAYRVLPLRLSGLAPGIGLAGWLLVFLVSLFGTSPVTWIFVVIALAVGVLTVVGTPQLRKFHERTGFRWFILQGAVDSAGIELVRSFIPMISTHAFFAQTMYTQPWMVQGISIFSVYALTVVILMVNFGITLALMIALDRRRPWDEYPRVGQGVGRRWITATGLVLAIWVGIGLMTLAAAPSDPETLRVAGVQHGFARAGHLEPDNQLERLEALSQQTRIAAGQGAQLVLWPELGLGFDPQVEHTAALQALAAETGTHILIGYGVVTPQDEWRNEAVMLTPQGEFLAVYGKNFPSTPGEPPIVTAGSYPVYETPLGNLATIICNDVNHTASTRTLARNGAQLITVPTLETGAPGLGWEQRTQMVLRAVENRVSTVKVDAAGIAMVVDPYGRILADETFPEGEAHALVADVPLGTGNTLYTRFGDWFGWLALAGLVVSQVGISIKPKQKK